MRVTPSAPPTPNLLNVSPQRLDVSAMVARADSAEEEGNQPGTALHSLQRSIASSWERWPEILGGALLGVGLSAAAQAFAPAPLGTSPTWLVAGCAVVWLFRRGSACWPGVWIAAFGTWCMALYWAGAGRWGLDWIVSAAATAAVWETLQDVGLTVLWRRFGGSSPFLRTRDSVAFLLLAAAGLSLGAVGQAVLTWNLMPGAQSFVWCWMLSWLAPLSALTVAMPSASFHEAAWTSGSRLRRAADAAALGGASVFVAHMAFQHPTGMLWLACLLLPVMMWAAFRLGPMGVGVTLASASMVALYALSDPATVLAAMPREEGFVALFSASSCVGCVGWTISAGLREHHDSVLMLRRNWQELADFLDQSVMGLQIVDRDGVLLWANRATLGWLDADYEELVGGSVDRIFEDPATAAELISLTLLDGQVHDFPAVWRMRDGASRHVRIDAHVMWPGTNLEHIRCYSLDVTRRKSAEEALRRAHGQLEQRVEARTAELAEAYRRLQLTTDELARSNRDLEQFAYVASHDLQEPLRMVSGFCKLLQKRYGGALDADADEYIGFAVDGARRMHTLINDLLEYSRVSTRGRPFVSVDCDEAFEHARDNLRALIDETKAHVVCEDLPSVWADRSQMAQLFQNLVGNALKFHGGAPPQVHVSAVEDEDDWKFAVRDQGLGLDPAYADRIFQVFQRLHASRETPGNGIGLAICKKIVERHQGRIWVESALGQGCTFYFTLPRGIPDVASDNPHDSSVE